MEDEILDESFFSDLADDNQSNIDVRKTGFENSFNERQVGSITMPIEPLSIRASLDTALEMFEQQPGLNGIPIEENDRVIGILERSDVENRDESGLKRFVSKTCGDYVKESPFTLNCSDFIESVAAKVNDTAIKNEVKHFVVLINNRSYYGIVSVAKMNERIEDLRTQDLEKAATIQQNILKKNSDTKKFTFDVSIWNKMANLVGGDFYVAKDLSEDKFIVGCFDVSGKNVSASLLTVTIGSVFSMFKLFDSAKISSVKLLTMIDTFLQEIVPVGNFITGAICYVDRKNNVVELYNCGHTNCFVFLKDDSGKGRVALLKPTLPPLGMGAIAEEMAKNGKGCYKMPIKPGLQIDLYSDGLTDMQNDDGERFGEDRAKDFFVKLFNTDVYDVPKTTEKTVSDWIQKSLLPDDITMINMRF